MTVLYTPRRHAPAGVVRVADVDDVRQVVRVARETGLELAVRAGGHSARRVRHRPTVGIVLDLRDLDTIDIDAAARTAWAGAGADRRRAYTAAAGEHGLAIGFGDTGSVGIGGITTGGGIGYLVRKYGLTIDNLARGRGRHGGWAVRHVDASTSPTCSGRSAAAAATSAS